MDVLIEHTTVYDYETPSKYVIQSLRKTPRNFEGQFVRTWWIEAEPFTKILKEEDGFGNRVHTLSLTGPIDGLTVKVSGHVDTFDTAGIIRGTYEPFPPDLYLSETPLTAPTPAIRDFARDIQGKHPDEKLPRLHALMEAVRDRMAFDTGVTDTFTAAGDAFDAGHGVCQDFAQIFIAAARSIGIPARYVGGYFLRADGETDQEAGHAWAEAFVPDLGWIGFDPVHCFCVTEQHVRVAVALDYRGAAPVRGIQKGGTGERMAVSVTVKEA